MLIFFGVILTFSVCAVVAMSPPKEDQLQSVNRNALTFKRLLMFGGILGLLLSVVYLVAQIVTTRTSF